ncbi:hypothetical protein DID88_006413 [Monilinia fructigena]|uniref:Uncharacterized protein n=1 Tax=Monilinia fructigena TaxID=38457 RepID=A0A395IDQ5_9HELO|nr:hypothetical protein DID88_006413 [Monilinia fructigena]
MPPSQIYYTNRYDHKGSTQSASTFGQIPPVTASGRACSIGLTQLAETLRSGIDSEKRGINPAHSQLRLLPSGDPPPIIDFGLKQNASLDTFQDQ